VSYDGIRSNHGLDDDSSFIGGCPASGHTP
jgi:hypothetical protein